MIYAPFAVSAVNNFRHPISSIDCKIGSPCGRKVARQPFADRPSGQIQISVIFGHLWSSLVIFGHLWSCARGHPGGRMRNSWIRVLCEKNHKFELARFLTGG
jgi:hypothetical protein